MKLRLRGASVRLRLTRGEVDTLLERKLVSETVPFGGATGLSYAVQIAPTAVTVSATLEGNGVVVRIPVGVATRWASQEAQVSISAEQHVGPGEVLKILIEKDWACLAPRDEGEDADAFPHPRAGADAC